MAAREGWRRPPGTEPRIEPTEKLGIFLYDWMRSLLVLGSHIDYATILYEGILDSIEFRVNGGVRCHIDMESWLSMVEPEYRPQRERGQRERFGQWKQWVTEKRHLRRLGHGASGKRPHDSILINREEDAAPPSYHLCLNR
ncbi:uncharacterized protein DNG_02296 [Cephalotrichum gorgonifer]|uniref:Uncharacterized protein n=1 Tax=Cephalotrichum gorgonifer TaxID=2041049 RepID=A0AAE8MT16_9PEZI|nr:uncharacterized protein DNG_02296 [Cephalotrichum gorgonifer]